MARGITSAASLTPAAPTTASDAPLPSITDTRANPAPSGFQADCRRKVGFADRLAVDEPGEGRRAAERLQREAAVARALLQAEVDPRAVGRKGDLQRRRLGRGHGLRRVLAQMAQRRRQVGGDARAASTPFGGRMISTSRPSRSKASNRIGAAAWRPMRPGVGPLSGRPTQTAMVVAAVEADRQRVAEAVGGAGLEGDAAA